MRSSARLVNRAGSLTSRFGPGSELSDNGLEEPSTPDTYYEDNDGGFASKTTMSAVTGVSPTAAAAAKVSRLAPTPPGRASLSSPAHHSASDLNLKPPTIHVIKAESTPCLNRDLSHLYQPPSMPQLSQSYSTVPNVSTLANTAPNVTASPSKATLSFMSQKPFNTSAEQVMPQSTLSFSSPDLYQSQSVIPQQVAAMSQQSLAPQSSQSVLPQVSQPHVIQTPSLVPNHRALQVPFASHQVLPAVPSSQNLRSISLQIPSFYQSGLMPQTHALSQSTLGVPSQAVLPVPSQSTLQGASQLTLPNMSFGNLPLSSQQQLPTMSQSHVPMFSQQTLPASSQLTVPQLSQSAIPQLSQSAIPQLSQSALPQLSQNALPQLSRSALPQLSQSALPQMSQSALPQMSQSALPISQQTLPMLSTQALPHAASVEQHSFDLSANNLQLATFGVNSTSPNITPLAQYWLHGQLPMWQQQLPALPSPSISALPSPSTMTLPTPSAAALPAPSAATLPSPSVVTLPAPSTMTFPAPSTMTFPAPSTMTFPAPSTMTFPAPSTMTLPSASAAALPTITVTQPASAGALSATNLPPARYFTGSARALPVSPALFNAPTAVRPVESLGVNTTTYQNLSALTLPSAGGFTTTSQSAPMPTFGATASSSYGCGPNSVPLAVQRWVDRDVLFGDGGTPPVVEAGRAKQPTTLNLRGQRIRSVDSANLTETTTTSSRKKLGSSPASRRYPSTPGDMHKSAGREVFIDRGALPPSVSEWITSPKKGRLAEGSLPPKQLAREATEAEDFLTYKLAKQKTFEHRKQEATCCAGEKTPRGDQTFVKPQPKWTAQTTSGACGCARRKMSAPSEYDLSRVDETWQDDQRYHMGRSNGEEQSTSDQAEVATTEDDMAQREREWNRHFFYLGPARLTPTLRREKH